MKKVSVALIVTGDGTRTVAEATLFSPYDQETPVDHATGTGSAGRERGDKSNQSVGDDLAMARALESLAAHLKKRANGRVRHAESIKAHRAEIAERVQSVMASPVWKSNL